MPLIYAFFSVWGLIQLIFCALSWIILLRYRSLTPLIIFCFFIEWAMRIFGSDSVVNDSSYSTGITPGVTYAPYVVIFLLVLFIFSLVKNPNNTAN